MQTTTWIGALALGLAVAAAGCGGEDKNDAEPRLIAGGGVSDGAIDGRVNVYVIDDDDEGPVNGATVFIGEPGEEPIDGVTDSTGLITIDDDALEGPTTITVVANGYVTSTWFGANGANVTIPLNPDGDPADPPQATLGGTIDAWDDLPEPAANHFLVGIVSYSQTTDLGDPANEIQQPGAGAGGLAPNMCFKATGVSECDWELISRAGTVTVFAAILDIDTKGTEDGSDDTNEIVGLAYQLDVDVQDGVDQSGLTLEQVEVGALTDVELIVDDPPSGLADVGVIVGMYLGDSGMLMVGFTQDPEEPLTIPELTGDFAGAEYRAFAFAGDLEDEDDDDPGSTILLRGITDLSGGIEFGEWMLLPTDIAETQGEYSFTPVDGSALHTVGFNDLQGDEVWGVALLDGRTSFSLPPVTPDPIPSGSYDIIVQALDGDIDLQDFAIDELIDRFDRVSSNRKTITP
jgi:hypothetical protein